jgi:hypothetical protein
MNQQELIYLREQRAALVQGQNVAYILMIAWAILVFWSRGFHVLTVLSALAGWPFFTVLCVHVRMRRFYRIHGVY